MVVLTVRRGEKKERPPTEAARDCCDRVAVRTHAAAHPGTRTLGQRRPIQPLVAGNLITTTCPITRRQQLVNRVPEVPLRGTGIEVTMSLAS